jgi:hypothetical protein
MNYQTFRAMQSGAKAMQQARGQLDVDDVDQVHTLVLLLYMADLLFVASAKRWLLTITVQGYSAKLYECRPFTRSMHWPCTDSVAYRLQLLLPVRFLRV